MNTAQPWSIYEGRLSVPSAGRITLEVAFANFVLARTGFPPQELPEIMTAPQDDGENDMARDMVALQSEWMVDAFVNGEIETFVRPIVGGEVSKLPPEKWEVDDPLARFETGMIDLDRWARPDAEPTHRIFVNEAQFMEWMRALQRPEHLTLEQIEKIGDPSYAPFAQPAALQTSGIGAAEVSVQHPAPPGTPPGVGPRLLDIKQVIEKVTIKRSTIYTRVKKGTFPDWFVIGGRSLWREDEINQWIEEQPRRK